MKTRTHDDLRIAEEAAGWLLRLEQEDTAQCHAQFLAWTKLSARNLHEFLFVKAASQELDGIDPGRTLDIAALGLDESVVSLRPHAPVPEQTRPPRAARRLRRYWPVAAAAAVVGLAFAWHLTSNPAADAGSYSTGVGEQRSFKLADGSLVHLNTHSRVKVDFSPRARDLQLLEGEALFVVTADSARPFRVDAGAATVQAIGTQFNVYRRAGATTVSVIEGRVRISDKAHRKESEAAAGEQARISAASGIEKAAAPDAGRALAWRERRLVFRADRLADVAAEFNRYNTAPIRVEGAARDRQMSGVFDADDPQPLLRFLGKDPQLRVETVGGETVVRPR